MAELNIVGHMMCRNEVDVIEETIGEILRWVDVLVVLDGGSTDGTWETICELAEIVDLGGKVIDAHQEPDPNDKFADHIRNRLLALTAPYNPDWVISVDTDEIYHYDPKQNVPSPMEAIWAADAAGANVVRCHVPQFWLTLEDLRHGAVNEDERVSVQKRRRWYSWGHMGTFIWRWHPDHYYPEDTPKRTPELPHTTWREWQRAGPLVPVCKHYCFRSLRQAMRRAEERRQRGGHKYYGKYYLNWLIDEQITDLHYLGVDDVWDATPNEKAVYEYMGRSSV
jgi:glycosyltransferase involved in cell wall biosynthesis